MQKIKNLYNKYKTPILYSGGSVAKSIAQLIVGFAIAKFVAPDDFGLWTTINLALTYALFLQAGIINGLNLELPLAYGKEDKRGGVLMAGTAQMFTLISSVLVFILGFLCFVFYPEENIKIKYGILAVTMVIALSYYQNYLMSTFRSNDSFSKLGYIQLIDALVNITTLSFVVYFSYYGLLMKAVVALLIYVLLLHFYRPIRVRLLWNKKAFIKLLKVGFPIFGLAYIASIAATADKIWLLKYASLTEVGLYSFGFFAFSSFMLFSTSIASYIYPKMTYAFAKNGDKNALWLLVKKITVLLLLIQIPLSIIGYYLIPIAVSNLFPDYVLSIPIMQILIFAGMFKGSVIGVNALWSMKRWNYIIIYQITSSLILVILTYIGAKYFSIRFIGVAYGLLLASFISLILGFYLTFKATREK
ncbi:MULTISPECIES: oligosaccharide flippase family protein [unclassified Polaribacter]|uniref:oligosaccharide flippase family protein n=1 Tax=unclassified Polaribacter TaxID=196858 RepID=UPI0011BFD8CA|nr:MULTISPECIES: oligosaccharide flippase family protein [unclassified Polaribacter]TXD50339.1 oligosaccharide flippase family protein [Polaribacter sp. IC063]TXD57184.1 oligosaccharide flippase family protein [Polaribacter sp. IC066]